MSLLTVERTVSPVRRLNSDKLSDERLSHPTFQSLRRPDGPIRIAPTACEDVPISKPDRPASIYSVQPQKSQLVNDKSARKGKKKYFKVLPLSLAWKSLFSKGKRFCKFLL
jgi:hypothetical protein